MHRSQTPDGFSRAAGEPILSRTVPICPTIFGYDGTKSTFILTRVRLGLGGKLVSLLFG